MESAANKLRVNMLIRHSDSMKFQINLVNLAHSL